MEDRNDEKDEKEDPGMKVDAEEEGSGLGNSPSRKVMPAWQGRTITIMHTLN